MLKEETTVLPMATKLLRDQDWAAIDAAIRHIDDPLFGKDGAERFAALRRQIERESTASKAIGRP
jgi:hemerythrin-like domain-containing protein